MPEIVLFYTSGSSDKEYRLQLEGNAGRDNWSVAFQYGRRGSASNGGFKIQDTLEAEARKVFEKYIKEKVSEGYTTHVSGEPGTMSVIDAITLAYSGDRVMQDVEASTGMDLGPAPVAPVPELEVVGPRRILWSGSPFLTRQVTPSPEMPAFQDIPRLIALPGEGLLAQQPTAVDNTMQVEHLLHDNGWGMQDKYDGKKVTIRILNGGGQAFNKKGIPIIIPQKIIDDVKACGHDLELDGELIGQRYITYDTLKYGSNDLRNVPYDERYLINPADVPMHFGDSITVAPLYKGREAKRQRFNEIQAQGGEGVVFKRLEAKYTAGKAHADMFKHKFYATCSCIVMEGREGRRSIGLGLVGDGTTEVTPVGNCTIPNKRMPSGYLSPVPLVNSVVEIRYLYAYRGGSLYQPTYIGPRDDVDVDECLMSQLKYKQEVDNG